MVKRGGDDIVILDRNLSWKFSGPGPPTPNLCGAIVPSMRPIVIMRVSDPAVAAEGCGGIVRPLLPEELLALQGRAGISVAAVRKSIHIACSWYPPNGGGAEALSHALVTHHHHHHHHTHTHHTHTAHYTRAHQPAIIFFFRNSRQIAM